MQRGRQQDQATGSLTSKTTPGGEEWSPFLYDGAGNVSPDFLDAHGEPILDPPPAANIVFLKSASDSHLTWLEEVVGDFRGTLATFLRDQISES